MLKNLFRSKKSAKEAEEHLEEKREENYNDESSQYEENRRGEKRRLRGEATHPPSSSFYHISTPKRHYRGSRSCFEERENIEYRSPFSNGSASKSRTRRPMRQENDPIRHNTSGYPRNLARSQTAHDEELIDSDAESWSATNHTIRDLRLQLDAANERKNLYKELYKRERRDRIQDRENRDLIEKKLIDDIRRKDTKCTNLEKRVQLLEQEIIQLQHALVRNTRDTFNDRVAHYTTSPSTSVLTGAGEALSSISDLLNDAVNTDSPDETKNFRHSDVISLEKPRDDSTIVDISVRDISMDETVLGEDKDRDSGIYLQSRSIRHTLSETHINHSKLKVRNRNTY